MPTPASSVIKNRAEQTEYEPILIIPPVQISGELNVFCLPVALFLKKDEGIHLSFSPVDIRKDLRKRLNNITLLASQSLVPAPQPLPFSSTVTHQTVPWQMTSTTHLASQQQRGLQSTPQLPFISSDLSFFRLLERATDVAHVRDSPSENLWGNVLQPVGGFTMET